MDKAEIQRQIEHKRKLLNVWRGHSEHVELQIAKSGFDVSSKLIQELREYQEQIRAVESEINNLEIQFVEEDYSLTEAEYRVISARAWKDGLLNVIGGSELQLARLKLKIPKQRADQIEQEIKTQLTRSIFRAISLEILWQPLTNENKNTFKLLYKLIKLNYIEFVDMTCRSLKITKKNSTSRSREYLNKLSMIQLESLGKSIIIANNVVFDDDLLLLHDAMEYLMMQLHDKNLLATPS